MEQWLPRCLAPRSSEYLHELPTLTPNNSQSIWACDLAMFAFDTVKAEDKMRPI